MNVAPDLQTMPIKWNFNKSNPPVYQDGRCFFMGAPGDA